MYSYTNWRCSWWGSVLEKRDRLRLRCGVTSAPIMPLRFSRSTVERWNTSTIGELRLFGGLISKSSSLWTGLTEGWVVSCSTALCHVSYQCPLHTLQGNRKDVLMTNNYNDDEYHTFLTKKQKPDWQYHEACLWLPRYSDRVSPIPHQRHRSRRKIPSLRVGLFPK